MDDQVSPNLAQMTYFLICLSRSLQEYLEDIAGSIPDHHNKVNIAIKQVTQIFWFPSAYKNYVSSILQSIKCAIALCLK